MSSGAIERTTRRLTELRHELTDDLLLAGIAGALSLVAVRVAPALAIPLLLGCLTAAAFALRSFWRRWDLVERLALDPDAYALSEVRQRGEKAASTESRHLLAASARWRAADARHLAHGRVAAAVDELEALARELDDESLALRPDCAVACEYLLTEGETSPLFAGSRPGGDLRTQLRRIRAGFEPCPPGEVPSGSRTASSHDLPKEAPS